jgi:hypothetical protein
MEEALNQWRMDPEHREAKRVSSRASSAGQIPDLQRHSERVAASNVRRSGMIAR